MKLATVKKKKVSLSTKYAATIIFLMMIGMTLLGFVLFYNQTRQNDQYIKDFGSIVVQQLATSSAIPLYRKDYQTIDALVNHISLSKHIISVAVFSAEGNPLATKGDLPVNQINLDVPYQKYGSQWRFEPFIVIQSQPVILMGSRQGFAVIVFSQKLMNEQFRQQLYIMFVTYLFILVIVGTASLYLGRKMSQPIRSLLDATQDIKSGKIDIIYERRNDELGQLIDAINTMSQGLIRKTQVEDMLDRILTKSVKDKIMDQLDTVHMAGEHVFATVLFADIVGFTSISEKISPEEVQKLLNEYYGYFNACARFYFGTVDKYIGDCVMVVFGATKADPLHQYNAIACAILMQKLARRLNVRREKEGLYPIELRIGINSGKMMAGLIGSDDRMEYTVVGDAVNLASRLCNEADGAQIIIEESLFDSVNPEHELTVEAYKKIRVRGKEEPVKIYSVKDVAQSYRKVMDDLIEDMLSRPVDH